MMKRHRINTSAMSALVACALLGCAGPTSEAPSSAATSEPSENGAVSQSREDGPEASPDDAGIVGLPGPDASVSEERELSAALVSVGARHGCVLLADGTVHCWRWTGDETATTGATPHPVEGLSDIVGISAGGGHTCALGRSGVLRCWGANNAGQLGDGTEVSHPEPVEVGNPSRFVTAALGRAHTCAVTAAGRSYCWGENGSAQLGDGTWRDSSRPRPVRGLEGVSRVFTSEQNTCALMADRTVRCWGDNRYGQIAPCRRPHYRPTAVVLTGAMEVVEVAVGEARVCTLSASGVVACRGGRAPLVEIDSATQLATGLRGPGHCALLRDGDVLCWGMTGAGCHLRNLGRGPGGFDCEPHGGRPADDVFCLTPVAIELPNDAVQIDVGESQACAVLRDGSLWCWSMAAPAREQLESSSQPPRPVEITLERGHASSTGNR